ncbi:PBS lyase [Streptomyces sp. DB-54]
MFTGIDDVDWASMGHAYGDASDVPGLLRGLASSDAAEREVALDGMYGAVHHQGDVYDSTVACIPFLFELVATDGLPGRGDIVDLLRSVDGDGRDVEEGDFWSDDEEEYAAWAAILARAESETRAHSGVLLELLDDADAGLRRALPGALVQLHDDPDAVLAALRRRLVVEPDAGVARALVAALGELGIRNATWARQTGDALAALLTGDGGPTATDPGLRLAVLAQLARRAPDRLPARTVEIATAAMREARDRQGEGPASEGLAPEDPLPAPQTSTMISYLRRLRASHRGAVQAPWATELLEELHHALDDQVRERFALLEDQLRSPDWGQRRAAIDMSGLLLTGWRGPYEESVRLLGEQMKEADPRIVRWAASELEWLYAIGGPAAEALAQRVAAGPQFPVQARWDETSYGAALRALAAQGDPRAVPGLIDVLRRGHVPEELGDWIGRMDPRAAAPLTAVLVGRLTGNLSGESGESAGAGESSPATEHLLKAAVAGGSAEALGPILHLLRTPEDVGGAVLGAALQAVARLGTAAREALPALRRLTGDGRPRHRIDAAEARWSAGGEIEAVLPVLSESLSAEHWWERHSALGVIGRIGPAAAPLLPPLRRLAASPEENGGWVAGVLAVAMWRAGADAEESMPTLLHAWSAHRDNRPDVAGAWARMGPAATAAVPLLRQEVAAVRRHNNSGGTGRIRYRCADDERLLRHARAALTSCGEEPPSSMPVGG